MLADFVARARLSRNAVTSARHVFEANLMYMSYSSRFTAPTSRNVATLKTPVRPFRVSRRRKDRHGRGQTGIVIFPGLPAWRTRREEFDLQITAVIMRMQANFPAVDTIEFAVEEVAPSSPAPWEDHDVCLARVFPRDRSRGLADRIVIYRQAVLQRCERHNQFEFLMLLLAERISHILAVDPEELLE